MPLSRWSQRPCAGHATQSNVPPVNAMHSHPTEIIYDVHLEAGEPLALPEAARQIVGPGHWQVSIRAADAGPPRSHSAFLNSYAPEDEGLYDDYSAG